MRILHLFDATGPGAVDLRAALLAESLFDEADLTSRVVATRWPAIGALLEALDVPHTASPAPGGRWSRHPGLAFGLAIRGEAAEPAPDLAHAWSIGALLVALLRWPDRPRLLTLIRTPGPAAMRLLAVLVREPSPTAGPTRLAPISETLRRELASGGVDPSLAPLVRPAVAMKRIRSQASAGDARASADLVELGSEQTHGPGDATWIRLAGAQLATARGDAGGGLPLIWAMAAGVPIVAEATYTASEIVEDRHTALLTPPGDERAMRQRIEMLRQDAQLAWSLRDAARSEAFSLYKPSRYRRDLGTIYRQLIHGEPLAPPPPPMTGGDRFGGARR